MNIQIKLDKYRQRLYCRHNYSIFHVPCNTDIIFECKIVKHCAFDLNFLNRIHTLSHTLHQQAII